MTFKDLVIYTTIYITVPTIHHWFRHTMGTFGLI